MENYHHLIVLSKAIIVSSLQVKLKYSHFLYQTFFVKKLMLLDVRKLGRLRNDLSCFIHLFDFSILSCFWFIKKNVTLDTKYFLKTVNLKYQFLFVWLVSTVNLLLLLSVEKWNITNLTRLETSYFLGTDIGACTVWIF